MTALFEVLCSVLESAAAGFIRERILLCRAPNSSREPRNRNIKQHLVCVTQGPKSNPEGGGIGRTEFN